MRGPRRLARWARWLPFRLAYGRGRDLASDLRKIRARLLHPGARIVFGPGTYLGPGFSLDMPHGGTFVTGPRVQFRRGFRAEVHGDGRIVFGADCVCTYDVLMQCTTSIDIGERCIFGQATIVVDGQHRFRDLTRPMLEQGYDWTPITIGDDVFITSKTTIMAPVGERAVVAANAVVTGPVPSFTVVGGVPARVIDTFGPAA